MTSLKTKSIQKNVQGEDNSSRESDNGPLYTDVDDFLQAESKANNPTDSEESKEEEDQDEVSELAKIDNLLRYKNRKCSKENEIL